jgi:Ca2+-binding EF-hand superfamily protein
MKTQLGFLLGGLALALCGQALANPAIEHEFKMMDTNKDGKISAAEHAEGAKAMFARMDADHDGKVTVAEMAAAHKAVTGKAAKASDMSAADKMKVVDADGDGMVTADEHAKASDAMFAKMDTNQDGYLSREEMSAGHASMMKKPSH